MGTLDTTSVTDPSSSAFLMTEAARQSRNDGEKRRSAALFFIPPVFSVAGGQFNCVDRQRRSLQAWKSLTDPERVCEPKKKSLKGHKLRKSPFVRTWGQTVSSLKPLCPTQTVFYMKWVRWFSSGALSLFISFGNQKPIKEEKSERGICSRRLG